MHQYEDDETIQAQSAHRDVTNRDEASIILHDVWGKKRPLKDCANDLKKDDKLYEALKDAHTKGKYDVIRNWSTLDRMGSTHHMIVAWGHRLFPQIRAWLATRPTSDTTVDAGVHTFLKGISEPIRRVVAGSATLGVWSPGPGPQYQQHLQDLRIPLLDGKPSLLLHNLGKEDPVVEKRVNNIFMPGRHTSVVLGLCIYHN